MTTLLDAEFRELIRSVIPEIIDLWYSQFSFNSCGADVLLKLSDQRNISSLLT